MSNKPDTDPDWLVDAHFGTVDTPLPEVTDQDDDDPDDELLSETPADIVAMLGFDPRELAEDAEEPDDGTPETDKHPKD